MADRGVLNNPNEGDKFAYWGEGEGVWALPSARALAVPVEPLFGVSPADAASIAIARESAGTAGTIVERGEARAESGPGSDVRTHHEKGFSA